MIDPHLITPPPELLQQWATEYWGNPGESIGKGEKYIAIQAARWGADQELEACVNYVDNAVSGNKARALRAARRPKPPSFAEDALEALEVEDDSMPLRSLKRAQRFALIRAALERLKELEQSND